MAALQGRRVTSHAAVAEPGDYWLGKTVLAAILPNGISARIEHKGEIDEDEDGSVSAGFDGFRLVQGTWELP